MKKLLFILLIFMVSCVKPQVTTNVIDTVVNGKIDSSYVVTYSDFVVTELWLQDYKITVAEDGIYPLQFIKGKYEMVIKKDTLIVGEISIHKNTFTEEELNKLIIFLKSNKIE